MNTESTQNYFKKLEVLTGTFKKYRDLMYNGNDTATFQELLVFGYAYATGKDINSRDVREFEKRISSKNVDYDFLIEFAKIFSNMFYRRELVTFSRELSDYIDTDSLKNNQTWIDLKTKIISTDENITKEELEVLQNADDVSFLRMISNYLTHELKNKYTIKTEDIDIKGKLKQIYHPLMNIKQYESKAIPIFSNYFHENTEISFRSRKLNKNFNFKINGSDLKNCMITVGISMKGPMEIVNDDSFLNQEKIITEGIEQALNSENIYATYKVGENKYKEKFDSRQVDVYLKTLEKIKQMGLPKNLSKFNVDGCFSAEDKNLSDFTYSKLFNVPLLLESSLDDVKKIYTAYAYHTSYESLSLVLGSLLLCKGQISFSDVIDDAVDLINRNPYYKGGNSSGDNLRSVIINMVEYSMLPEQLYREVLLTQTLNLLEYFEATGNDIDQEISSSQKDAKSNNAIGEYFEEIVQKYPDLIDKNNKSSLLKHLRNSIVHMRYIAEQDIIHFYDGQSKDQIKYRFSLTLEEIEEIKDLLNEELMKNMINSSTNDSQKETK